MHLKRALVLLLSCATTFTAPLASVGDEVLSESVPCMYRSSACSLLAYRSLDCCETSVAIMSPQLTLEVYEKRAARQSTDLRGFSTNTTISAELPDSLLTGEFELHTEYVAPATLRFTPVHFVGDHFVKSNVINRYLQAENQHVVRHDQPSTAINSKNYSFHHVMTARGGGCMLHHYAVKARRKRVGLFDGEVAIDAETGSLRMAKGTFVKSPSFFVKEIEFEREYEDLENFTVPVHLHLSTMARFVGRVELDVTMSYHSIVAQATETLGTSQHY